MVQWRRTIMQSSKTKSVSGYVYFLAVKCASREFLESMSEQNTPKWSIFFFFFYFRVDVCAFFSIRRRILHSWRCLSGSMFACSCNNFFPESSFVRKLMRENNRVVFFFWWNQQSDDFANKRMGKRIEENREHWKIKIMITTASSKTL